MTSDFEQFLDASDRSEKTIRAYDSDLQAFKAWFEQTNGQAMTAPMITTTDLREYKQFLIQRRRAPASINRGLAAIRCFCEWAISRGLITDNPVNRTKAVAEQPHAPRWLDRRQLAAVMREVERQATAARRPDAKIMAQRNHAMIAILAYTGLRVGELCRVNLSDVELSERKGEISVWGKGQKLRKVLVGAKCRAIVRAWIITRHVGESAAFVSQAGERLHPRDVQRLLVRVGRRAGVALTPHTLRHTFAKSLVDAGTPLNYVAELLGHSHLETTRIYTMPSEGDLQKAVELLE